MLCGWEAMAAYRRVYGFGHLRADCRGLGSAPEGLTEIAGQDNDGQTSKH